jgi:hypothetical protein
MKSFCPKFAYLHLCASLRLTEWIPMRIKQQLTEKGGQKEEFCFLPPFCCQLETAPAATRVRRGERLPFRV